VTTATERRLRIPADLARIAEVRAAVREVAEACDAPIDCEDDLVQAVDEAVTNVIVHGYAGAAGDVEIHVGRDDQDIVITIEDRAPAFDPRAVPTPDLAIPPEHRRPGGMGVHLMREAADDIAHRPRTGGGNILTITRRMRRSA
jgi:anti-sigma regulatory factor (Ser/Thr protein kinase)